MDETLAPIDQFTQKVDDLSLAHKENKSDEEKQQLMQEAKEAYAGLWEDEEVLARAKAHLETELSDIAESTELMQEITVVKQQLWDFKEKVWASIGAKLDEFTSNFWLDPNKIIDEVKENKKKYALLDKVPVIWTLVAPGVVAAKKFFEHSVMWKKISSWLSFLWFDNEDNSVVDVAVNYFQNQWKKLVNRFLSKIGQPPKYPNVGVVANTETPLNKTISLNWTPLSWVHKQTNSRIAWIANTVPWRSWILKHNDKVPDNSKKIYSPVAGTVVWVKTSEPENNPLSKRNTTNDPSFWNYLVIKTDENGPFKGKTYHVGHIDWGVLLSVWKEVSVWDELASIEFGSGTGTNVHYSDWIGWPDDTVMADANLADHIEDTKKLANITIEKNGDKAKVSWTNWEEAATDATPEEVVDPIAENQETNVDNTWNQNA